MDTSIIIPTLNREEDLKNTLIGILQQTKLPKEIIIVDDSDTDNTEKLIKETKSIFSGKGIDLIYLRNEKERSSAIARNLGADQATAEIILFLDDDVSLDKTYIEKLLEIYDRQGVLGVQGYVIENDLIKFWRRSFAKVFINSIQNIFFLHHYEKDNCRVLPSGESTFPYYLSNVKSCEWLSGTNQSYRRDIFMQFKFDEKLKKYSLGEDLDLSYRINKAFPNSLFITPYAILYHNTSETSRLENRTKTYMKMVYGTYLYYKNIESTPFNRFIFFWSRTGGLFVGLGGTVISMKRQSGLGAQRIRNIIDSYIYTIRHLKDIKDGNLNFFM